MGGRSQDVLDTRDKGWGVSSLVKKHLININLFIYCNLYGLVYFKIGKLQQQKFKKPFLVRQTKAK